MALTAEKLETRRKGLGGSDSPIVLGVSPFMKPSELWRIKSGLDPEQEETPAMKRGTYLEPVVADLYAEMTGRKVRRSNQTLYHPEYDWMLAHIDRQINAIDDRGPGVLEIKCPGLRIFSKCKREGLPNYYLVQQQHYLAVSGRKWGAFAVFNAERWELIFFDVNRDDEIINIIIAKDFEFMQALREGKPVLDLDAPEICGLPPAEPTEIYTMDSPDWKIAIEKLKEAREIKAEAEALEEEAAQAVKTIMESNNISVAEGGGARIYYKIQKGRESFDKKKLASDHPEIDLTKYIKTGSPFRTFKPYFLGGNTNE